MSGRGKVFREEQGVSRVVRDGGGGPSSTLVLVNGKKVCWFKVC